MNIPVNPIGVPPEEPTDNKEEIINVKPGEKIRPNTPDNANKHLTPKQKMQIKIRRVKEKQPRQPILLGAIALLLALFFLLGNIVTPVVIPSAADYKNQGIQLTFLGDVMLGRYIKSEGEKNGYEQFYNNVKNVWKNSDYVFANLETAVLTKKNVNYTPFDKKINISTDTQAVASMIDAGINAISFSNNHSCDFSKKAFTEAISWFNKNNLTFAGYIDKAAYNATKNLPEAQKDEKYIPYTQITANGKKIGFIAVTDKYYAKTIKYGLLTTADGDLNSYINKSALENDITVVYAHWGEEYQKAVDERQETFAHQFIDAGADIVIGCHPHILQKVEKYKEGMIFYSLGNFIMDQNNTFTCDSAIVQYNEDASGKKTFEIVPVRINNGVPSVTKSFVYKNRIKKELMSEYDSSKYSVSESGNITINF